LAVACRVFFGVGAPAHDGGGTPTSCDWWQQRQKNGDGGGDR